MDDSVLWIVGAIAVAVVVAALVWVLRHRGHASPEHPHHYEAPAVTQRGTGGRSSVIFGGSGPLDDDAVDRTVPLSRLGGAGWRDGGGVEGGTTTDAYAASAGTWAEPHPDGGSVHVSDPHVTVHDAGERRVTVDEADERRGGHW